MTQSVANVVASFEEKIILVAKNLKLSINQARSYALTILHSPITLIEIIKHPSKWRRFEQKPIAHFVVRILLSHSSRIQIKQSTAVHALQ